MNARVMMITASLLVLTALGGRASASSKPAATPFQISNCNGCLQHAKHLRGNGFDMMADGKVDLALLRKELRIPEKYEGCRVATIDRYAVEGRVAVHAVNKLITDKPDIIRISLPGFPIGPPGLMGPKSLQSIQFVDSKGKSRRLAEFRGTVVLLNIWATWCVPCRKEMPALDRLEAALGGPDFQVVPLSVDSGGMPVVRSFYADVGIKKLGMYLDTSGDAMRKLGVVGLPTTLLLDRAGGEIGRLIGPAEWDQPENIKFIKCIIDKSSAADTQKTAEPAATAARGGRAQHFPVSNANGNPQIREKPHDSASNENI